LNWRGVGPRNPGYHAQAGQLIASSNYEPAANGPGYTRIQGFERFDGQPKPSVQTYWVLPYDTGTTEPSPGDTVTGATSGATGILVTLPALASGSWAGNDAAGDLILREVTGTFQAESITFAAATGAAVITGAGTDALDDTYTQAAMEQARALIAKVPGSGVMRGVWQYNDVVYGFRDNAGGTAVDMYKSTAAGWVQVALKNHIQFDAGTAAFTVGATLTGGTSGATATILNAVLRTGAFGSSDATGTLVLDTITGGPFQDNETITDGSGGSATAMGASQATALVAGGRFEFVNENFQGQTSTLKMYGCDGVSTAFEFDGTVFTPVYTGMPTDTPSHIFAHRAHLFLSFTGGSIQQSSPGAPFEWTVVTGAAELAIGDEPRGFANVPGEALAIFSRHAVHILHGTGVANWQLNRHSHDVGAKEWSIQDIGWPVLLDDRGVVDIRPTQEFGDFKSVTMSEIIQPMINLKRNLLLSSQRVRAKDQYRMFFSDGTAIYMGIARGKVTGFFLVDLGINVHVTCSLDDASGGEILFIGDDAGYVHQMDAGNNFDGTEIVAYARLPYYHLGYPRRTKRMSRAIIEVDAQANTTLNFQQSFDYGDPDAPSPRDQQFVVTGGGGFWEEALWDEFSWDDQIIGNAFAYLDGTGYNMSLIIRSSGAYALPHTLQAVTYFYRLRRLQR
jgi:hypothetical protein